MKLVVDENIELGREAFGNFGDVVLSYGRKITNEMLQDCDALIVRSITKVNETLLKNTSVKFVGTTTIGTDHLDIEYLDSQKIKYASAPGCNSFAVAEYVLTAVTKIADENKFNLADKKIGVVGYGNIGKKITRFAKALGMQVFVNDPPLEREGFDYQFSSLEKILECDIITLHVPMNKSGLDKTLHLFDEEKINELKPGTILINSSRGAVVDNNSLFNRLKSENDLTVILDVWENEPKINRQLLEKIKFGTQHIAGYSLEGKVNGTKMIYNELCNFLNQSPEWQPILPDVENSKISVQKNYSNQKIVYELTSEIYPIQQDSNTLKELSNLTSEQFGEQFDLLRKNYKLRREFNNYSVISKNLNSDQKDLLKILRFQIF